MRKADSKRAYHLAISTVNTVVYTYALFLEYPAASLKR